ncbi:hypothetical protein E2C01_041430 [Portunus trituberculatus]|uniref:Uncharacterized protein n=1 Tax=Portunus trituberculatus TaxID=210409 RepID=A0A5B7FQQ2_PORTR|nr:hypothetical protein [Portunus trituberculatus]
MALFRPNVFVGSGIKAGKPLPQVRKPNLHSDRGQDSNSCAWRPLGPQSTHGSTVPRQPITEEDEQARPSSSLWFTACRHTPLSSHRHSTVHKCPPIWDLTGASGDVGAKQD